MSADHECRRGEARPPETTVCVESKGRVQVWLRNAQQAGLQPRHRPTGFGSGAAALEWMWAGQGPESRPPLCPPGVGPGQATRQPGGQAAEDTWRA